MPNANTIFLSFQVLIFLTFTACLLVGDTYLSYMKFNSTSYNCENFSDIDPTPPKTSQAAAAASTTQAAAAVASTTQAAAAAVSTTQAAAAVASTLQASSTQAAATTQAATTTLAPTTTTLPLNSYSVCYSLTDTQLGFARFKIVMFWVFYAVITLGGLYYVYKLFSGNDVLLSILMAIILIMSVFILVGGIFTTQYAFNASNKICLIPTMPTTTNPSSTAPATTMGQVKQTLYCYNLNTTEVNFARMSVVFGWLYTIIVILGLGAFIFQANLG